MFITNSKVFDGEGRPMQKLAKCGQMLNFNIVE